MMVMSQWFVNITKTTTWVLRINVNSGFFSTLYWNQCVILGGMENFWRPLYRLRTTGNQPFLLRIWMVVSLKFPLNYVKRTCVLIITFCLTGLNLGQLQGENYEKSVVKTKGLMNKIKTKGGFLNETLSWVTFPIFHAKKCKSHPVP